eukprot:TRINITY_DN9600_c0_g1_i1.p1 TRINITY_DN9600_c0_g1~~TRINITY_DN9600_c0_g1_i1.p1  ORF type:complete len:385 (+),score=55.38 TRINITY_DN9600_c0_g1_i1:77-1231(+)
MGCSAGKDAHHPGDEAAPRACGRRGQRSSTAYYNSRQSGAGAGVSSRCSTASAEWDDSDSLVRWARPRRAPEAAGAAAPAGQRPRSGAAPGHEQPAGGPHARPLPAELAALLMLEHRIPEPPPPALHTPAARRRRRARSPGASTAGAASLTMPAGCAPERYAAARDAVAAVDARDWGDRGAQLAELITAAREAHDPELQAERGRLVELRSGHSLPRPCPLTPAEAADTEAHCQELDDMISEVKELSDAFYDSAPPPQPAPAECVASKMATRRSLPPPQPPGRSRWAAVRAVLRRDKAQPPAAADPRPPALLLTPPSQACGAGVRGVDAIYAHQRTRQQARQGPDLSPSHGHAAAGPAAAAGASVGGAPPPRLQFYPNGAWTRHV